MQCDFPASSHKRCIGTTHRAVRVSVQQSLRALGVGNFTFVPVRGS
ncbi:MAG: hypothetical protein ACRES3_08455 [Steroidobacteraceae bacterium]